MKKLISALFLTVLALSSVFGFAACARSPELGTEYKFSRFFFERDSDVKITDLSMFVPAFPDEEINSVKDLENYITKHIEDYSIVKLLPAGGNVTIPLKNEVKSIKVGDKAVTLNFAEESKDYQYYVQDGDEYILAEAGVKYGKWEFERGRFYYSVEFTDDFEIKYEFRK